VPDRWIIVVGNVEVGAGRPTDGCSVRW